MKWIKHRIPSDQDMNWIKGTDLMLQLMKNRLVIRYDAGDKIIGYQELGLWDTAGHVYMAEKNKDNIELYFENSSDMVAVEAQLSIAKLASE